jgi:hypothetical protein
MGRYPILLLAVLAFAGCDSDLLRPPPPVRGEQLTGEQLKSALSGNSLVQDESQPPLVLFFAENGELRGIRSNHYQDRGSWRVENDRVCGKWNNWYGTLASCWTVYRSGNRLSLAGERSTDVLFATLAPGNVADLQ